MLFDKIEFIHSLLCNQGELCHTSIDDFFVWFKRQRTDVTVKVERIPFSDLAGWAFNDRTGNLVHKTGRFFSIEGISVSTNFGVKRSWQQPIINQPEIGILGMIAKKFNGVLHFLMQAKIEPGNLNFVQLSPTLQATRSNYMQAHGGNAPLYIEYFTGQTDAKPVILVDQLQSEQGARFLKKRNRNVIIEVQEEVVVHENFIWLTLGQIKDLLRYDNVVNMDTRTVISSISYGNSAGYYNSDINHDIVDPAMILSVMDHTKAVHTMDHLIAWIAGLKTFYELDVEYCPLNTIECWQKTNDEIFHNERRYFSIIGLDINIQNREVARWSQPIVQSVQEGIIGFLVSKINGVYHFLVQAKVEAGNFDILELAPTVQCLTGNYRKEYREYDVPFLDYFINAAPEKTLYKGMQSEEGGRFFREQNMNIIVESDNALSDKPIPNNYKWMTLAQLMEFGRYNNYLNIQTRSLLSILDLKRRS